MPRLTPDQILGNYRIVGLMGEGGMGAVYEVVHVALGRRAALKVLHADPANDPQIGARFLKEATAGSRVQHPGVVQIFEYGQTPDGILYFVMEYLDGESLSARLRRYSKVPAGRYGLACLLLMQQVARALAAVHKLGFVHRDLKPGNVMIVADSDVPGGERAKVLDFGIAKSFAEPEGAAAAGIEVKTRTGLLMGTPDYMAPEQWRSQKLDSKVDIYALGNICFEALTGRVPFVAADLLALGIAHCFNPLPPLARIDPKLPAALCRLVERMLDKEPAARPTMSEVADALDPILGVSIDTGSHPALRPATALSQEAKALLDVEPRTLSGRVLDTALSTAPPAPDPTPAPDPGPRAANVPVEIPAEPTAPLQSDPQKQKPSSTAPLPPDAQKSSSTAPTLKQASRPSRWLPLLVLLGIASGASTWALLHDWRPRPSAQRPDFGSPADLQPPAVAPDLAAPPDLYRVPEHDHLRPAGSPAVRPRPRGNARLADDSCILTGGMTTQQRDELVSAFAENSGIHLYPGERLVIVGLPRKPSLSETPSSLRGQALELFLRTLRGLQAQGKWPAKVEIQCGK